MGKLIGIVFLASDVHFPATDAIQEMQVGLAPASTLAFGAESS
jgi:hypothetical protein